MNRATVRIWGPTTGIRDQNAWHVAAEVRPRIVNKCDDPAGCRSSGYPVRLMNVSSTGDPADASCRDIRAVLIEDDDRLGRLTARYLDLHGVLVTWVTDGKQGLAETLRSHPDIVLLDLMLPGLDGLSVCRELRARTDVPIIMVTARDEEADRVLGLELGADDYMPKPFSSRELLARIHANVRRVRGQVGPPASTSRRQVGLLARPRRDARRCSTATSLALTAYEFSLLRALAAARRPRARPRTAAVARARQRGRSVRSLDRRARSRACAASSATIRATRACSRPCAVKATCSCWSASVGAPSHRLTLRIYLVSWLSWRDRRHDRARRAPRAATAVIRDDGALVARDDCGAARSHRRSRCDAAAPRTAARAAAVRAAVYDADGHLFASNATPPLPPLTESAIPRLGLDEQILLGPGPHHPHGPRGPVGPPPLLAVLLSASPRMYALFAPPRLEPPIELALIALGCVLLVTGATSIVLARSFAQPLSSLSEVATKLGAGDLNARARSSRRDEFGQLARAFDEMAERITNLLRSQQELFANVSHELRTPLARIRVALDLAGETDAVARKKLGRDRRRPGRARAPGDGRAADRAPRSRRRPRRWRRRRAAHRAHRRRRRDRQGRGALPYGASAARSRSPHRPGAASAGRGCGAVAPRARQPAGQCAEVLRAEHRPW